MRGGQISMEYLILISIVVLIMMPLIVLYYQQANSFTDQTASALAERATREIVRAADTVYYLGAPSSRTITVELPQNILGLQIAGKSVSMQMSAAGGAFDQVAWSAANLTGSFSITPGPHVLVIAALEDGRVNITE